MNRIPILLPLALCSCTGIQSVLDAQGQSAVLLSNLIFLIVFICAIVWLCVMAMLFLALFRRDRTANQNPTAERAMGRVVACAVCATVAIIAGLTVFSFYTTRGLNSLEDEEVTIRVRAQQWWWQFIYHDRDRRRMFQTANEIHVPVGKTVRVFLEGVDVIHSFWVPSLAGKQDAIPGRENVLTFRANRAGIYRGQCAEFCGLQHSHMAFLVIAEPEDNYLQWEDQQRGNSMEPREMEARSGKEIFMNKQCSACHTIRGTLAAGTTGPDLTHVGSRLTIGAGLLERTPGSLAAWIADPQTLKPGNNMPLVPLTAQELRQVAGYLEGLK